MERVIADSYVKGKKHTIEDEQASEFNKRVLAVNRMYGYLYEKGILEKTSFLYQDLPEETHFALDVKCLKPYRRELENSGVEDAQLAVRHIFDEPYTPCAYSGAIQLGWLMMTYREVDGCVGRSWECDLVKHLGTHAVQEIYAEKEAGGVKAAVRKMFSYFEWPQQPAKQTWICVYRDVLEQHDEEDNLTDICVPTDWLMEFLKKQEVSPQTWFAEYTADDTQEIARKAMEEGVILDCSDSELRSRLSEKGVMAQKENPTLYDLMRRAKTQGAKPEMQEGISRKTTEPER